MANIDTHAIIKELIATGTPEKTAEVLVSRFVTKDDLNSVEKEHAQLATKMDIVRLESSINGINTNIKWLMAIVLVVLGILLKGIIV